MKRFNPRKEPLSSSVPMVYGIHASTACLIHMPNRVTSVFMTQDMLNKEVGKLAQEGGYKIHIISKEELSKKCGDSAAHQNVMLQCQPFPYKDLSDILETHPSSALVLDGIEDPRNLGRAARLALAFGVDFMVIPKDRACQVTAAAEKAAAGALASLPVVQVTNLAQALNTLKNSGLWVIGTKMDAPQTPWQCDFAKPFALVIGNEETGLRRLIAENCDEWVAIPMASSMESLNAADAAGILLYEAAKQRLA